MRHCSRHNSLISIQDKGQPRKFWRWKSLETNHGIHALITTANTTFIVCMMPDSGTLCTLNTLQQMEQLFKQNEVRLRFIQSSRTEFKGNLASVQARLDEAKLSLDGLLHVRDRTDVELKIARYGFDLKTLKSEYHTALEECKNEVWTAFWELCCGLIGAMGPTLIREVLRTVALEELEHNASGDTLDKLEDSFEKTNCVAGVSPQGVRDLAIAWVRFELIQSIDHDSTAHSSLLCGKTPPFSKHVG